MTNNNQQKEEQSRRAEAEEVQAQARDNARIKSYLYHQIASDQEYDTLAANLPEQLRQYPTREIMFKKRLFSETQYNVFVLSQHQGSPKLDSAIFLDTGSMELMPQYLDAHLKQGNLPKIIRILAANRGRPNWALFFVEK